MKPLRQQLHIYTNKFIFYCIIVIEISLSGMEFVQTIVHNRKMPCHCELSIHEYIKENLKYVIAHQLCIIEGNSNSSWWRKCTIHQCCTHLFSYKPHQTLQFNYFDQCCIYPLNIIHTKLIHSIGSLKELYDKSRLSSIYSYR